MRRTRALIAFAAICMSGDALPATAQGPNTAAFIEKSADLGTLEAAKLADIVRVDGDPLDLIHNVLNVRMVLKGGTVVGNTATFVPGRLEKLADYGYRAAPCTR
jgi:hypothetical protein